MVQVSFPGVYVQEIPSGSHTITGVATSIAAFVGMSKDGPVGIPTLVLGFTDYTRTFSNDVSQGEMTDQVRQFFLNGGQQAYIVRIGTGIVNATATLTAPSGATLALTALSGGADGNSLRAIVDYDTASPESTFNLTVFEELIDAGGNSTTSNQEVHSNLSMDPSNARFVTTVLTDESALVSGVVANNALAAGAFAFSASGTQQPTILQAILDSIPAGGVGKFKIGVGGGSFRTISIPKSTAATTTAFATVIQSQLPSPMAGTVGVAVVNVDSNQFLMITSTGTATVPPTDIVLDRASDSDIAQQFGLGVAQGGLEVGAFSTHRPPANGLASVIGNVTSATEPLANLMVFAASAKSGWTSSTFLSLIGGSISMGSPAIAGSEVTFPDKVAAPNMRDSTTGGPASLLNVQASLFAIASTITSDSANWSASVEGFRLVLRPKNGLATAGAGASFDPAVAPLGFLADSAADASIFGGVTSVAAASELELGDDGSKPAAGDYLNAYTALDKVDLFNLLMLPKSVGDNDDRTPLWGPASSFALSRRAFLIMDLSATVQTVSPNGTSVPSATAAVVSLRAGIVKDHAASYWPRVKINPDGNARFIDPNGTIAGIMARIDGTRGVWKAPAGLEADLRGVLSVEVPMSDAENGLINPLALNAIRTFPNGIVTWGARTMDGFDNSGDDDFKYIPVRRLESFIEESLIRGLKFAVFEPNDEPLWSQLRLSAGAFMNNLFRQGAFAGQTTSVAYFVKVDSETTTQNDINLGIVNVVIGFAPLKPAEFVVITIQQLAGQVQV